MAAAWRLTGWLLALAAACALTGPVRGQTPADLKPIDSCPVESGCRVEGGHYRIVLPQQARAGQPGGAIMYFHGYQGSAEETIADQGLVAVAQRLGVALIAMDGMGHSWSFPGSPAQNRDEFAYVGHVLDDVARRFPVDPGHIMASGFSQGGSMVWYLACRMPARFAAFAPIAGAFWEPLPERCAGPRPSMIHIHGTGDTTVPMAGRILRQGSRQGDVFRSLAILAPGGCTAGLAAAAQKAAPSAALTCGIAEVCGAPARLELCLHAGGHMADPAWVERAWRLTMPANAPPATASAPASMAGASLTSP